MTEPIQSLLQAVQILRLRPGDVLVVEADELLNMQEMDDLKTQVESQFPDHKVVVTNGVKLRVAREETA